MKFNSLPITSRLKRKLLRLMLVELNVVEQRREKIRNPLNVVRRKPSDGK